MKRKDNQNTTRPDPHLSQGECKVYALCVTLQASITTNTNRPAVIQNTLNTHLHHNYGCSSEKRHYHCIDSIDFLSSRGLI